VRLGCLAGEQLALGNELHAQRGKHGLQLLELAWVVRGQNYFHEKIRGKRLSIKREQLLILEGER
jgi:hypothetical protein